MTRMPAPRRTTKVALGAHVRPGDDVVIDGRTIEIVRVRRAQGRKPARGENLHLVAADDIIKINSLDGIRIQPRPA